MAKQKAASGEEAAPGPLTDFRFGTVAVWGGLVEGGALEEALREQAERRSRGETAPRIGEMLVGRGLLTDEQARRVLRVQLQRMPEAGQRPFGPIAVARRFATPQAVSRALDEQSREILGGGDVRHLGDILAAAGAIRPEEVEAIFAYQAKGDSVPMSEARKREGRGPSDALPGRSDEPGRAPPAERPVFLPRGVRGFLIDNSIWIIAALAAALAAGLALFREAIFS